MNWLKSRENQPAWSYAGNCMPGELFIKSSIGWVLRGMIEDFGSIESDPLIYEPPYMFNLYGLVILANTVYF